MTDGYEAVYRALARPRNVRFDALRPDRTQRVAPFPPAVWP
jgi:hypothetical protein